MTEYKWYKNQVPSNLKVKQVYGIVFDKNGRVLLRVDNGIYKLTGGKPEETDLNYEHTLKREYLEELNVELENIHYLGYLQVTENQETYAQVRMIAKIKNIKESLPDTDSGKLYQRFMSTQNNVKKYLNYPDIAGTELIDDAIKLANELYEFTYDSKEQFV